jgi:hypothetical protein
MQINTYARLSDSYDPSSSVSFPRRRTPALGGRSSPNQLVALRRFTESVVGEGSTSRFQYSGRSRGGVCTSSRCCKMKDKSVQTIISKAGKPTCAGDNPIKLCLCLTIGDVAGNIACALLLPTLPVAPAPPPACKSVSTLSLPSGRTSPTSPSPFSTPCS